ncbi:MAG: MTAP family purine nucleoside phosphorylase [Candidatus Kariarchaeaceae archaeon]|jgi:5'-methylthioadenosine phosphorylase
MKDPVCIIGGSGLYGFLPNPEELLVHTPFRTDPVVLYSEKIDDQQIYFLPRHGKGHSIPPHKINFKANVYALHKQSVSRVISTSAVGSVRTSIEPGTYVLLDQFIDFIRPLTYFEGDFELSFEDGEQLSGVVHTDMTSPYCPDLGKHVASILSKISHSRLTGTYFCSAGPRFETPAEIKAIQTLGGDVVGMTNSSEAILCRELGICYNSIAVVTNMAAGLQQEVNHQEVIDLFDQRAKELKNILKNIIAGLPIEKTCTCRSHIKK